MQCDGELMHDARQHLQKILDKRKRKVTGVEKERKKSENETHNRGEGDCCQRKHTFIVTLECTNELSCLRVPPPIACNGRRWKEKNRRARVATVLLF